MKWFKSSPEAKLQKRYAAAMLEARDAQRSGKIQEYARLMEEAEAFNQELHLLKSSDT